MSNLQIHILLKNDLFHLFYDMLHFIYRCYELLGNFSAILHTYYQFKMLFVICQWMSN